MAAFEIKGDPGRDAMKATSGDAKSTGVSLFGKTGSTFGVNSLNVSSIIAGAIIIGGLWIVLRKERGE
jgi:hypothetical protein